MTLLFTATLFLPFLIEINSAIYILDNNINIRIVSLFSDCNDGRLEFFNGSAWGTLSDCTESFKTSNALSICKSLGFELEREYWRGTNNYDKHLPFNPAIAYTKLTNCSSLSTFNICADCAFTNDLSSCNNMDPHQQYDIFISCDNYGFSSKSSEYNCTVYEDYIDRHNVEYKSCAPTHDIDNASDTKPFVILITIAIFGSICCVFAFTLYSKYQETKRLSTEPQQKTYDRSSGFATVPQEVQLGPILGTMDDYVPPPQPIAMFVYQTRQTQNDDDDDDTNAFYDVDNNDNDNGTGYDMEEIIPNVILYSKNRSTSESYGLIKNQDDDDDADDVEDGYLEPSKS